jgi:CheY-like chemotaxis protein
MNCLINARDAIPEDGTITVKTENVSIDQNGARGIAQARPGDFICISIADTGTGMDEKTLKSIFEPFFTTKKDKGTGLGLSAAYGIVKQHKGWINVTSKPGAGTTFKIFLPADPSRVKESRGWHFMHPGLSGKGKRILVVEDSEDIRNFSATAFTQAGYRVFKAANADEALALFKKENGDFHLVFSDLNLPGKSGLQLAEELNSMKPDLKIIMTSGYAEPSMTGRFTYNDQIRFIGKPYSYSHLLKVVNKLLQ